MKTINDKLSKEQAQKELKQFATLGLILGIVPLLIFGWLSIAGLAFSVRALVLTRHPGNKENPKLKQYKAMAITGAILSVICLALLFGQL